MKPLHLTIERRTLAPLTELIRLEGRLMLGPEGQQLEAAVRDAIANGAKRVIIDLAGITHIDSTGIGRCIASLNLAMQGGAQLHMAGAVGHVRQCFHVTRLDRVFRFFDDIAGAQQAFGTS